MPTFIQPPEPEEEYTDTSGSCMSVETEDGACFSLSTFDEGCFFINHGAGASYVSPPRIFIEEIPLAFTGIHVQDKHFFILNGTTIYSYIWEYDKTNKILYLTGKTSHTITGVPGTPGTIIDIQANSNTDSLGDIFVGNSAFSLGANGYWINSVDFSAKTGHIDGREFNGNTGDVRMPTGSEPDCASYKISCEPASALTYPIIGAAQYLKNLSGAWRKMCQSTKPIYKFDGVYYFYENEMPEPTVDNFEEYEKVLGDLIFYYTVGDGLVAGLGQETDTDDQEKRAMLCYGGTVGYVRYKHYERVFNIDLQVYELSTCIYEMGGWETGGRAVFPDVKSIVVNTGVDVFVNDTIMAFVGEAVDQADNHTYGVFYTRYDINDTGRVEKTLSYKEVPWTDITRPTDITLVDSMLLYRTDTGSGIIIEVIELD